GPAAGEVHLAAESVGTLDVGRLRHREAAGGHHVPAAGQLVAGLGAHVPAGRLLVAAGGVGPAVEADVASQVVLVGDGLGVAEDLGLGRVLLRPGPLVLELRVEAVGVVDGRDVAARPRVPVPVPGAAD